MRLAILSFLLVFFLFPGGCRSPDAEDTSVTPTALPPATETYESIEVTNGGSLSGLVTLAGKRPKLEPRPVDRKNPEICGSEPKPSQEVLLGDGGTLANVVITIEGIKKGKPMLSSPNNAILDQRNCDYVPHVQVVARDSTLDIFNNDDLLHNVHGKLDGRATVFNLAMPLKGQELQRQLSKAGVIHLQCDAGHTWMKGYIIVVDSPYFAATDTSGSFTIDDIPAGIYTLKAWHERFGTIEQQVTVSPGDQTQVSFEFTSES